MHVTECHVKKIPLMPPRFPYFLSLSYHLLFTYFHLFTYMGMNTIKNYDMRHQMKSIDLSLNKAIQYFFRTDSEPQNFALKYPFTIIQTLSNQTKSS